MAKKLLLHSCCGPCSTSVVDFLRDNFWEPTAFFYNPNIHPEEEYQHRTQAMYQFCNQVNIPLILYGDYGLNLFLENLSQLNVKTAFLDSDSNIPPKNHRCAMCYTMRM